MTRRDYRFPLSPWALTDEVIELVVEATKLGAYAYQAAEAAGIGRTTYWKWMKAADRIEAEIEELRELSYRDLRKRCSELGLDVSGKKEDLLGRLVSGSLRLLEFRNRVRQAQAMARAIAEGRLWEKNPEAWLKYGPGREREGAPGWTNAPGVERGAVEPAEPEVPDLDAGKVDEIDYDRAAAIAKNLESIGYFENVVAIRRPGEVEQEDDASKGDAAN